MCLIKLLPLILWLGIEDCPSLVKYVTGKCEKKNCNKEIEMEEDGEGIRLFGESMLKEDYVRWSSTPRLGSGL